MQPKFKVGDMVRMRHGEKVRKVLEVQVAYLTQYGTNIPVSLFENDLESATPPELKVVDPISALAAAYLETLPVNHNARMQACTELLKFLAWQQSL